MKIHVITMFPAFFDSPLRISLVGKAIEAGSLEIEVIDLRDWGIGEHRRLDDAPFGGGAGMVMMAGPLGEALAPLADTRRILLTPSGIPLDQAMLDRWAGESALTLVCGRYEGVDQRVIDSDIDEEVSLGDYVLLGGEVGALAVIEGIARLVPGVIGNPESTHTESFRDGLLEEPQYTRPADLDGKAVPAILLSGDHAKIAAWRQEQREERTRQRRPDLWEKHLSEGDPAG